MNRKRRADGTALVEMAIMLPLLVLILSAVLTFGWAFYIYNALERAVRDGARYAATRTYAVGTGFAGRSFATVIRNVVVCGEPNCATQNTATRYRVPGLTTANMDAVVNVQAICAGGAQCVYDPNNPLANRPSRIVVSINSFDLSGPWGALIINNKPSMSVPYIGRYAPVLP
jgi:hypothetical protein